MDKWLTSHVSDHSALNHRKNVVSALVAISSCETKKGRLWAFCRGQQGVEGLAGQCLSER